MQHIEFFEVVPEFGFEITPKMTQPSAQYPVLKGLRERFFISAAVLLFCPNFRPPVRCVSPLKSACCCCCCCVVVVVVT